MSRCIKPNERTRQWLWFIGLWSGGLASVLALSYLIKWAIGV